MSPPNADDAIEAMLELWLEAPSEDALVRILRAVGKLMLSDVEAADRAAARVTEVTGIPVTIFASRRAVEYDTGGKFFHQGNGTRH